MKKIVALGGSNSKRSINKRLAVYAAGQVEDGEIVVVDLNDYKMPLYSPDLEKDTGIPENTLKLDAVLASASGIILSLAEYNGSYTAVFKNAFDWLSRINRKVWKEKPILLMSTSPGGRGGTNVLKAARETMPRFGGIVIAEFSLPCFHKNFDREAIVNEDLKAELKQKILLFQKAI